MPSSHAHALRLSWREPEYPVIMSISNLHIIVPIQPYARWQRQLVHSVPPAHASSYNYSILIPLLKLKYSVILPLANIKIACLVQTDTCWYTQLIQGSSLSSSDIHYSLVLAPVLPFDLKHNPVVIRVCDLQMPILVKADCPWVIQLVHSISSAISSSNYLP